MRDTKSFNKSVGVHLSYSRITIEFLHVDPVAALHVPNAINRSPELLQIVGECSKVRKKEQEKNSQKGLIRRVFNARSKI